ncbi:MAG TPA: NAD-dependent succinate-semialdehyde dehydrogenase, partial [Achromobacter sp.]|nr:NAD-dependent succinate-semialdehyde dehydrogenase [Achromobacter sp.]
MNGYPDTLLLIDNEWREARGGARIDVVTPATGQKIGQVASASREDLDAALAAAQRGF